MAEIILLNRIRVDIGNVSGSLSELMQYAGMAGFNDNYEPQTKPRLVGTWTINDWYTTDQLAQAQAAFDGLTIVEDPNYFIDFSQMAVQTLDDTQPNYNPAAAIILQNAGLGNTISSAPVSGQTGRWFLSKTQAAAITNIGDLFKSKTAVTDTNGIAGSDTAIYNFESFNELKYFTSLTSLPTFSDCTNLSSITIPNSVTILGLSTLLNTNISGRFVVPSQVTTFGAFGRYGGINAICKVTEIVFEGNNLTTISNWAFGGVYSITSPLVIPDSVTSIGTYSFYHSRFTAALILPASITNIGFTLGNASGAWTPIYQYVWLKMSTPPSFSANIGGSFKIYVGDGSSAEHDNAILANYIADSNWSAYSSRLDTWYNYLHPTT